MQNLTINYVDINSIKEYKNNPKLHNRAQINKICDSIHEFGFTSPILVDENGEIIAGHGRVAAARQLGLTTIPAIPLSV